MGLYHDGMVRRVACPESHRIRENPVTILLGSRNSYESGDERVEEIPVRLCFDPCDKRVISTWGRFLNGHLSVSGRSKTCPTNFGTYRWPKHRNRSPARIIREIESQTNPLPA